jgi:hypothetical protein
VILGGLLTGAVSLWQAQLITRREREARQALREQERKDRRDAFQRETLLAMQDAVEDARQSVNREYERKLAIWNEEDRHYWEQREPGDPLPKSWNDADARITKLWARVFDGDLESTVSDFQMASGEAITAQTQDGAFDDVNHVGRLAHEVNSRIGVLLDDLF